MIPFVHIGTKRSFNEKDRFVPKELFVLIVLKWNPITIGTIDFVHIGTKRTLYLGPPCS